MKNKNNFLQTDKKIAFKYPIITICGSSRFKDEMVSITADLTLGGYIVLSLGLYGHVDMPEIMQTKTKTMLDDMHKRKIDLSEAIFVVNVGGYIGESTRSEIEYARAHGKQILYLEGDPLFERSLKDVTEEV